MSAAATILAQPLCALAFCWRLERRDGVTLGLTSHDRPLDAHGLRYTPATGINPAAILRSGDSGTDVTEVAGALGGAAISAEDLALGRWDGAALSLRLTEWTAPGALWLLLAEGTLGTVEQDGKGYSAALRGVAALFDRPACPQTSPTCRAELGDAACAVDLRRHRRIIVVDAVDGRIVVPGLDGALYRAGSLRWLSGPATGTRLAIAEGGGGFIVPAEPLPIGSSGALALLTEGCDKRLATCASRFANAANFRGEPHLPGNDLLTRYPGA